MRVVISSLPLSADRQSEKSILKMFDDLYGKDFSFQSK